MTNFRALARLAAALAALPLIVAADTPPRATAGALSVELSGVRNAKGVLFLCLSASARHFPDCNSDPAARTLKVPASKLGSVSFGAIAAGDYALSVMHDENGNSRLDTMMSIPREGFGFSRNPVVRFGPPKFSQVRFAVGAGSMTLPVKMRYFL